MRTHERVAGSSRTRKTPMALALATVLMVALAAYGAPPPATPYEINTIIPLTGSAAFLGRPSTRPCRSWNAS